MTDYEIKVVDAFTSERYSGNPCGVVTRAGGLTDEQMQRVAREMNLSETAFVTESAAADFRVRFFTPRVEIPLAGHPTIATMFALAEEGRIDLSTGEAHVTQELNVGVLPVDLRRESGGQVTVVMTQAKPSFGRLLDGDAFADALGIGVADLVPNAPAQVVSTGTPQAMIPVRSIDVLRRIRTDMAKLATLEAAGDFFSVHVFALDALDAANHTHARHFAATAGIAEDPFTGSATGGMAAYLWKHGLLRQSPFRAEQGHLMGRPGLAVVEVEAEGDEPTVVRVAGQAVTVLRGVITL